MTAIAHRWGFAGHAHFSRSFRAVYGLSPAERRQAGGLQAPLQATGFLHQQPDS